MIKITAGLFGMVMPPKSPFSRNEHSTDQTQFLTSHWLVVSTFFQPLHTQSNSHHHSRLPVDCKKNDIISATLSFHGFPWHLCPQGIILHCVTTQESREAAKLLVKITEVPNQNMMTLQRSTDIPNNSQRKMWRLFETS